MDIVADGLDLDVARLIAAAPALRSMLTALVNCSPDDAGPLLQDAARLLKEIDA